MGTYEDLKAAIQQVIRTNGNNEITGALLQQTLLSIVNSVGANAAFAGIATPNTNPGTTDQNVFYLATEAGTYVNFGGVEIAEGEAVILSNKTGNWTKITSGFATQQQLTELGKEINIGTIGLGNQVWGVGDIDIPANGPWTWYEGEGYNIGVCTLSPIRMKAGTKIKLSDYSVAKIFIGWRVNGVYSRHEGWIENGVFTCPIDAEYVINIRSVTGTIQTDFHTFADLILILTPYEESRASDADVKNNRNEQTQQIRYYTPIFTIVTIDIPANGPWTWYYDDGNNADVGTKYPIFLKKGSTIRLTDYSGARMYIGWRVNGVYSRHEGWIESGVFTCPIDAEYVISIRPIPLVEQENYEALANLIIIANPIASNSASKTDVVTYRSEQEQQIHYFTPIFAVGTLDIPANSPWAWYEGTGYDMGVVTKYPIFLKKNTIIKLSDYSGARMYIGWRVNGVYSSHEGWISDGYFRCPIDAEYVINIQSIPQAVQSSINNLANLLQIENETYLMALRNPGMYNPFMNAPYYAHLAVNSFMKNGEGQNAIPNNSLFEIEASARLGYKIVELKPKITSDGKYIIIHGSGGNFSTSVYSLDGTDITNVPINSKSLAWIKENVRYNSDIAKYRTTIPTLEEALICCKENCIAAFVEAINYDIITICRQYLADGSLFLYAAPIDTREQTGFGGFIFQWYNLATFTKDYILNEAKNYGAPFIAGIGATLMGALGDSGTKELIDALHKDNFLASCASQNDELRKFFRFGGDACAALYQTNPIDGGNVYDLDGDASQFGTTGQISNNQISLESGQSVICGNTDVLPLGRCYLVMRFSGTVNIQFGCGGGIRTAQSDGNYMYFDSDYLVMANDKLTITATAPTIITMLIYKSLQC